MSIRRKMEIDDDDLDGSRFEDYIIKDYEEYRLDEDSEWKDWALFPTYILSAWISQFEMGWARAWPNGHEIVRDWLPIVKATCDKRLKKENATITILVNGINDSPMYRISHKEFTGEEDIDLLDI